MDMGLIIVLVAGAVVLFWAVTTYNRLVGARNAFGNAFAQIDVQLTRRYELIPNLVSIAKEYLRHERDTLEAVIQARNQAVAGLKAAAAAPGALAAMTSLEGAEAALSGALGRLFAVAEAYPDLKANQTMAQLSEELTSTENRVAFARQAYNDAVLNYNNLCEMFPGSVIAGLFRFMTAKMLEVATPEARNPIKVSFS
ncbi:MAG: LemA family protein [Pseudomonadota bacterium]